MWGSTHKIIFFSIIFNCIEIRRLAKKARRTKKLMKIVREIQKKVERRDEIIK